jgi:hypothetical protein
VRNIGDLINWFMWKNVKKIEEKEVMCPHEITQLVGILNFISRTEV